MNLNDNNDDDERQCECSIESGDLLEAHTESGSRRAVRVETVLHDLVAEDLTSSSRTQLVRTEDGGWVVHEEFWDDCEQPEAVAFFEDEDSLTRFLWRRRRALDLVLLNRLGHLALKAPTS